MSNARAAILSEILEQRFSCRGYHPDPVPRETIEEILSSAQRMASWCNAQPWMVHIAGRKATDRLRGQLASHLQTNRPNPDFEFPIEYRGVYQARRRECGLQLYQAVGVARGDKEAADRQRLENFRFFGAPHVAVITVEESLGIYGVLDCGAYVQNFMLAARSRGVASIAQAALALYPNFWREQFNLKPDRKVVCGISFGFEDPLNYANQFRTQRAHTSEIIQWID